MAIETRLVKTTKIIEQGIAEGLHLGAQLFVMQRGEILADVAIGSDAPGSSLTKEATLPWMSSGKPLTAIAIAQLSERKQLDIFAPVGRYVREFAQNGKEAITVEQLLTHTGGFRGADKAAETLNWEETLTFICQSPMEPNTSPGSKGAYHVSSSWFVLGEVIQRVSGESFANYVEANIFRPLGMQNTAFCFSAGRAEELGRVYVTGQDTAASLHPVLNNPEHMARPRPGSSARGPIRELASFYNALSNAGRDLVSRETAELFTRRHRVGLLDETFRCKLDWGYGFLINTPRATPETILPYGYGKHASSQTYGHSGSQSSAAYVDPDHQLVVAWVCNGMPGERLHQVRSWAINNAIYEDLGLRY